MVEPVLKLYFSGGSGPVLQQTVFRHHLLPPPNYERRASRGLYRDDPTNGSFVWGKGAQAMSLFFLPWSAWALRSNDHRHYEKPKFEGYKLSHPACLDYALSRHTGWLTGIFGEDAEHKPLLCRLVKVDNSNQKQDGPVAVALKEQQLPPRCILVYLDDKLCEDPEQLDDLRLKIHKQWHKNHAEHALNLGPNSPEGSDVTVTVANGGVEISIDRESHSLLVRSIGGGKRTKPSSH